MFELGSIMQSGLALAFGAFVIVVMDSFSERRRQRRYKKNCEKIAALVPEFLMMGATITHKGKNEVFYLFPSNAFGIAHYCLEVDPQITFEFFTLTTPDSHWSTNDLSDAVAAAAGIMNRTKERQTKGA